MKTSIACVGIIKDNNGKVLLTRRDVPPFQYQYVMPGGKLDIGESVYNCVKREVFEEVGLKVTDAQLFDIYEAFLGKEAYFLILYFKCKVEDFNITINEDEVLEYVWVDANTYLNFDITEGTKYILKKVFDDSNN